jgi:hypothetical protein
MKRVSILFISIFVMDFLLCSCAGENIPKPLERAIQAAEQMTSRGNLEQSAFYAIFPQGTPQQFVSFLFSDIGAAERPPVEGSGELSQDEEESMRNAYMPIWPAGIGMTHSKPDAELGMQVVWKWDDSRRVIILEGYVDPTQPPVIVRETDLPIVQTSEIARLSGQSATETGGRSQGF